MAHISSHPCAQWMKRLTFKKNIYIFFYLSLLSDISWSWWWISSNIFCHFQVQSPTTTPNPITEGKLDQLTESLIQLRQVDNHIKHTIICHRSRSWKWHLLALHRHLWSLQAGIERTTTTKKAICNSPPLLGLCLTWKIWDSLLPRIILQKLQCMLFKNVRPALSNALVVKWN